MNFFIIGIAAIVGLGIIVAIGSWFTRKDGQEEAIVEAKGDCSTCNDDNPQCEQVCMMEAATKEIEYFDDEELDRFKGRPSDSYSDEEVEQFSDVLYTMRPTEVKAWNRSLHLRGIAVPDPLKDELFMMMEERSEQ